MSHIILPKIWRIPEREITLETDYHSRRHFLKLMGFAAGGIAGALYSSPAMAESIISKMGKLFQSPSAGRKFDPIPNLERNKDYTVNRAITQEAVALKYNNFYEFTSVKDKVWTLIDRFETRPWEVEVAGLVENPAVYDIDDLIRSLPMEERVYRHRCVETWAMVAPWNGFPMKALIDKVKPTSKAKYIKFVSFLNPEIAPGQKNASYRQPWPYTEGLSMKEAMNELTFLATGIYGHTLPPQHGAPVRLVVPWKYGFKGIKSIVKIEFTSKRPATFWNTLIPHEYGFTANVNPAIPHPRWSQRREKMIGTGDVFATQIHNGYGNYVAYLYA
ncbi:oxidoreductase [Candidatus Nitromaritima sp. SCGC AAA799-A02]|nr:oxidoreductase [Candidatus Nitromaritima sp. SCGC AAA799-C22]KMP12083.1 oxidoreductase [Candidatus Nitromaritima sp. SCGC AAA799-A02]